MTERVVRMILEWLPYVEIEDRRLEEHHVNVELRENVSGMQLQQRLLAAFDEESLLKAEALLEYGGGDGGGGAFAERLASCRQRRQDKGAVVWAILGMLPDCRERVALAKDRLLREGLSLDTL